MCVCILNHFAVHLKLIQHYKSITLQFSKKLGTKVKNCIFYLNHKIKFNIENKDKK